VSKVRLANSAIHDFGLRFSLTTHHLRLATAFPS
jgi:hypothetical protein